MAMCTFHPDRETYRSCSRCGLPACHDCLVDAPVGAQCRSCVKAARPSTSQQLKANFRQPMIVTQVLLAVIAVVFFAGGARGMGGRVSSLHERFAVFGPAVRDGEWWRIVTSGFLHFGIIHLLFNAWALWNVGQSLERGLGRWRYISLFLVSVLGGSAGALWLSPDSYSAGASGGLFGLFAAGFMGSRARNIPFGASGWGPTLLINLFITFSIPGISIGGHLGGALAGAACGAVLLGRRSLIGTKQARDRQDITVLVAVGAVAIALALIAAYR
jgi:membrane associated rhomboid family serine protease